MNEGEPTGAFNVLTFPNEEVAEQAIGLSKFLAGRFQTAFVLDKALLLPHLTLYLAQYPLNGLVDIQNLTEQVAAKTKPLDVYLRGYSVVSGFVFWDAEKSPELDRLHYEALDVLHPLRARIESYIHLSGLTQGQEQALARYGNVSAGPEYIPHITLTRMVSEKQGAEAVKALPSRKALFRIDDITLAVGGPNGTCSEIIKKFPLKGRSL